jgi:hypothetical protein
MSEGPSRNEIERVREALERHDSKLREQPEEDDEESQDSSEEQNEDG